MAGVGGGAGRRVPQVTQRRGIGMPARYTDDANEFVIGVTSHRFLAEVPKLRASVRVAVRRIADRFPDRTYVLLSSLAEGADRTTKNADGKTPVQIAKGLGYRPVIRAFRQARSR